MIKNSDVDIAVAHDEDLDLLDVPDHNPEIVVQDGIGAFID